MFVVSSEGGAPRRLTHAAADDFSPAWSADGHWIYFSSNRTGEYQSWKMPAVGSDGEAVQITRRGGFHAFPAPDGKTIFYAKKTERAPEKVRFEIWRVPAEAGGEGEPLPEFARAGFNGTWTMTRAGIYFLARQPGESLALKFYDFADGKIKDPAGNFKIPDKTHGNLDATADGGKFLYALYDQNASSIMLAEIEK